MIRTAEEILDDLDATYFQGPIFSEIAYEYDEVIKGMKAYGNQFKPKWIPVTEPPTPGVQYNIRIGKSIATAHYVNVDWVMKLPHGKTIEYTGITHYCKLPEL